MEAVPIVNGSLSAENMCRSWLFQPRRDMKAPMMSADPRVKQIANFEGARMMTGRKREKARIRNTTPDARRARNHVKCVVEGRVDWALQCTECLRILKWVEAQALSASALLQFIVDTMMTVEITKADL